MKTAWEKKVVVDQNQNRDPFEHIDTSPMEILDAFNNDQTELFDYVQHIADNGFEEFDETITAALVFNTSRSFAKATTVIRETSTDEEAAQAAIKQFWEKTDCDRVELFRTLLGNEVHQFITHDELDTMVKDAYSEASNPDEIEAYLMDCYKLYLQIDTYNMLRNLQGDPEDVPPELTNILYDQGPKVAELIGLFEEIAERSSQEYKDRISEGYMITDGATEPGGDFATSITLKAERTPIKNSEGKLDFSVQYELTSLIEYDYEDFDSMPPYIREYLLKKAAKKGTSFTKKQLTDEESNYTLKFTYSITVDSNYGFWPHIDLDLYMDGNTWLPLPDNGEPKAVQAANNSITEMTEDERALFGDIFSEIELQTIETTAEEFRRISETPDVLEAFRQKMGESAFVPIEEHVKRARNLAQQLIRSTEQK
jgi:hypothetical protein